MRVDELRRLAIFEGVSDERLEQLLAVGRTIEIEPGLQLFTEGEPADALVGAGRRRGRPVPDRRPRGGAGRADAARPVGRRVPGVGRRRRVPRDRTRRGLRPAAAGAGGRPARPDGGVAAAGRAPGARRVRDRPLDRGDGPPARGAGHPRHAVGRARARAQQPGRGRGAHRGLDGRDPQRAAALAGRARRGRDQRRAVPRPRRAASRDRPAPADAHADAARRRRGRARRVARGPRHRRPVDAGLDARGGRRPGRVVRAAPPTCCPGAALQRRARVGRGHAVGRVRSSRSCARRPAASPSSSAPCAPTRRWTAPPCSPSTSSRDSRARS